LAPAAPRPCAPPFASRLLGVVCSGEQPLGDWLAPSSVAVFGGRADYIHFHRSKAASQHAAAACPSPLCLCLWYYVPRENRRLLCLGALRPRLTQHVQLLNLSAVQSPTACSDPIILARFSAHAGSQSMLSALPLSPRGSRTQPVAFQSLLLVSSAVSFARSRSAVGSSCTVEITDSQQTPCCTNSPFASVPAPLCFCPSYVLLRATRLWSACKPPIERLAAQPPSARTRGAASPIHGWQHTHAPPTPH
jgi:hypothetical protein